MIRQGDVKLIKRGIRTKILSILMVAMLLFSSTSVVFALGLPAPTHETELLSIYDQSTENLDPVIEVDLSSYPGGYEAASSFLVDAIATAGEASAIVKQYISGFSLSYSDPNLGITNDYNTTLAEVDLVNTKIEEEFTTGGAIDTAIDNGDSEYRAIYNYITGLPNTPGDAENGDSNGQVAYDLLFEQAGVCAAYADLGSKMLTRAGIDNQIQLGIIINANRDAAIPHAWNSLSHNGGTWKDVDFLNNLDLQEPQVYTLTALENGFIPNDNNAVFVRTATTQDFKEAYDNGGPTLTLSHTGDIITLEFGDTGTIQSGIDIVGFPGITEKTGITSPFEYKIRENGNYNFYITDKSGKTTGRSIDVTDYVPGTYDYTITFKDFVDMDQRVIGVNHGESVMPPTPHPRDGMTFVEWDSIYTNITEDRVLRPVYSNDNPAPEYTVTFEDYDGSMLKVETVEEGNSATPPLDPVRAGWTFTGWNPVYSNITSDLTVRATYTEDVAEETTTHSVVFLDYDGTELLSTEALDGEAVAFPGGEPVRDGFDFTGWNSISDMNNITSDSTFTAQYEVITTTHVAVFLDYDGTELEEKLVLDGDDVVPPEDPTREGYIFIGWNNDLTAFHEDRSYTALYYEAANVLEPTNDTELDTLLGTALANKDPEIFISQEKYVGSDIIVQITDTLGTIGSSIGAKGTSNVLIVEPNYPMDETEVQKVNNKIAELNLSSLDGIFNYITTLENDWVSGIDQGVFAYDLLIDNTNFARPEAYLDLTKMMLSYAGIPFEQDHGITINTETGLVTNHMWLKNVGGNKYVDTDRNLRSDVEEPLTFKIYTKDQLVNKELILDEDKVYYIHVSGAEKSDFETAYPDFEGNGVEETAPEEETTSGGGSSSGGSSSGGGGGGVTSTTSEESDTDSTEEPEEISKEVKDVEITDGNREEVKKKILNNLRENKKLTDSMRKEDKNVSDIIEKYIELKEKDTLGKRLTLELSFNKIEDETIKKELQGLVNNNKAVIKDAKEVKQVMDELKEVIKDNDTKKQVAKIIKSKLAEKNQKTEPTKDDTKVEKTIEVAIDANSNYNFFNDLRLKTYIDSIEDEQYKKDLNDIRNEVKESNKDVEIEPIKRSTIPPVILEGKEIDFTIKKDALSETEEVKPFIKNGRTMTSVRVIAEEMGAEVSWRGDLGMVTLSKNGTEVNMFIDKPNLLVNGESSEMDITPIIRDSRTYLPARYVAESLKSTVLWNEEYNTVFID